MKTRMIKPLLAIACLLSSINASAYDFEVDGIYYDVVSFSDFTCKVVEGDNKYAGDIVIPATVNYSNKTLTVVEIAKEAFWNCEEMTGITIPNTIASIDGSTFKGCGNLVHVKIEDGNTDLKCGNQYIIDGGYTYDYGLFYYRHLTSIYIGRNLIGSPFGRISSLKDVTISNSVTWIGGKEFYNCSGLTSVTIPNSVTKIGESAFRGCSGLTSVTIPNSVTKIGSSAFGDCSSLTSMTIPNSVTEIGESAFRGCSGLTSVTIPNSVTRIGSSAFYRCSGLTSVTIPNSVTEIGEYAFSDCNGLTNMTIPNSVTEIGDGAFENCSGLTSMTIPNSVTEISKSLFKDCSSLTSVTIGNYVTKIYLSAFDGCSLTKLYLFGIVPPIVSSDFLDKPDFSNNQYMTLNVYVPQEALEAYQNADVWKNFWNLQGFDPTGIKGIETDGKGANGKWYDLRGNGLDAPKRGLNIINGKKVIVK